VRKRKKEETKHASKQTKIKVMVNQTERRMASTGEYLEELQTVLFKS